MTEQNKRENELAREIVAYFDNIECLGKLAGEDVHEQKVRFAAIVLRNYACERFEAAEALYRNCAQSVPRLPKSGRSGRI